jgi:hypothetical protein
MNNIIKWTIFSGLAGLLFSIIFIYSINDSQYLLFTRPDDVLLMGICSIGFSIFYLLLQFVLNKFKNSENLYINAKPKKFLYFLWVFAFALSLLYLVLLFIYPAQIRSFYTYVLIGIFILIVLLEQLRISYKR